MEIQKLDPYKRAEEKRLQRNQDVIDLMSGRFSRTELQRRNSMFSQGITAEDAKSSSPFGLKVAFLPPEPWRR